MVFDPHERLFPLHPSDCLHAHAVLPLVNTLASLILMEHNVGAELFTPPTYYSLTALGKELFADPDIIDVDKQQMPQTLPYEQLQAAVLQEAEAQEQELLFLTEVVPMCFP